MSQREGLNVLEAAVEGVTEVAGLAIHTCLEHIPGTAEHAVARDLKQMQPEEKHSRGGIPRGPHVRFQEDVKHPDETKPAKLARTPTPMVIPGRSLGQQALTVDDLEYGRPQDRMRGGRLRGNAAGSSRTPTDLRTVEEVVYTHPSGVTLASASQDHKGPADTLRTADEVDFVEAHPSPQCEIQRDPSVHTVEDYDFTGIKPKPK